MKKYIFYSLIFFSLLVFACKSQSNAIKNADFENYIKSIPQIDLPYSTTCGSCCNVKKLDIDTSLIRKYNPDKLDIVGKLTETDNYIGILYAGAGDYIVPVLIIYDKNGNKTSEQQFMGDYCGQVVNFYGNYYLNINKQMQITEIDTSYVFKMDTVSSKIIDTLKKEVKLLKYEINDKGGIIKK